MRGSAGRTEAGAQGAASTAGVPAVATPGAPPLQLHTQGAAIEVMATAALGCLLSIPGTALALGSRGAAHTSQRPPPHALPGRPHWQTALAAHGRGKAVYVRSADRRMVVGPPTPARTLPTHLGFSNSTNANAGGRGGIFRSMLRMRPYCAPSRRHVRQASSPLPADSLHGARQQAACKHGCPHCTRRAPQGSAGTL